MATITDFLPEELKRLVEERVRERHLASPEAYISALIQSDVPISASELRQVIVDGLNSPKSIVPRGYWAQQADALLRDGKLS